MRKGTYKGPIEHLVGKTALLYVYSTMVEAQFDDVHATLSGYQPRKFPLDSLGYGWTYFPVEHWDIDE